MAPLTVIKQNLEGQETFRYSGNVLVREDGCLVLEATYDHIDMDIHGLSLRKGDRFVETYYADRWYNIYEIYRRDDGKLLGWYCNICYPALIGEHSLSFIDLALDLLVLPDGTQVVLDEDEFAQLPLSAEVRARALSALAELRDRFLPLTQG